MQTISSAIQWWANNTPDQIALRFGSEHLTYQKLHVWTERIAASLLEQGLKTGDRVAICGANSMEYCALLLGIIRAGGIASPLNARYTSHEIAELVEDTTPRFAFIDDDQNDKFASLSLQTLSLGEIVHLRDGTPVALDVELNPDAAVVIIATSGSTAKPKGVMLSHRSMMSYVAGFAIEESSCQPGSRVVVPAPLSTSAGFVQLIHYTALGCTLYFEALFDPDVFLQILVNEKINLFGAVPVFFERVAACKDFEAADLSNIKLATTGGARVSRQLQDQWMKKGIVLRQIYGQTEAGGNATIMPEQEARTSPEKCGRGGVFTELAIVDEAGNHLPPGNEGQIIIRGPGTMLGYWNNPEATADALRDGWLYTGDIGVLDDDGMLTFVDRLKDIIISGGLNISAAEVERCVSEFPGILEVMVIGVPDDRFGETPMAVIYATDEIAVDSLIAHCNERLANFKVPRYVAFEHEPLPRTATGKLAKPPMREKYKDAATTLAKVR